MNDSRDMSASTFRAWVGDRLQATAAQSRPRGWAGAMSYGRHQGPPNSFARDAAVMISLLPRDRQWVIPVIVRPSHVKNHAGQVSLPGGALERGEAPVDGARRETEEELGFSIDPRHVVGSLPSLYLFHSHFQITPWVSVLDEPPEYRPEPAEVARVIEFPWNDFPERRELTTIVIQRQLLSFSAPAWHVSGATIWGATLMILADLVWRLRVEPR